MPRWPAGCGRVPDGCAVQGRWEGGAEGWWGWSGEGRAGVQRELWGGSEGEGRRQQGKGGGHGEGG